MPGSNAAQVLVGGNGKVWIGPTTAVAPSTTTGALDVGFIDMGFTTEDGVTITAGKTIQDIAAWQSFYPIRKLISARAFRVGFTLRQWLKDNVILALQGAVTGVTPNFRFDPSAPEVVDQRSCVIEWTDGTKNYRVYIPVCLQTEDVEVHVMRTDAANLPLSLEAVDPGGGIKPYSISTNDPAFS